MALEALKLEEIYEVKLLKQEDLVQKIDQVAKEVLQTGASPSGDDPISPRMISAADLVRRMKPFLVYN